MHDDEPIGQHRPREGNHAAITASGTFTLHVGRGRVRRLSHGAAA